jgi:thiol-disulfide isomerase/thioredoxin
MTKHNPAILSSLLLLLAFALPAEAGNPPDIRGIDQFSLEQYKGKVVYLDFWASWCKPCRKSFPWMNALKKKFPADRFEVVTINLDSEQEPMMQFLEHVPADFTIYHDASGRTAEAFKLPGMPTSYIIDRNGKPVSRHIGFYSDKTREIEAEIEKLL